MTFSSSIRSLAKAITGSVSTNARILLTVLSTSGVLSCRSPVLGVLVSTSSFILWTSLESISASKSPNLIFLIAEMSGLKHMIIKRMMDVLSMVMFLSGTLWIISITNASNDVTHH
jgi:hypothetical protein